MGHDVGFDHMGLSEGRAVHDGELLKMLSFSINQHVVLHGFSWVQFLVGIKRWLSWTLGQRLGLGSELWEAFVLIVHIKFLVNDYKNIN